MTQPANGPVDVPIDAADDAGPHAGPDAVVAAASASEPDTGQAGILSRSAVMAAGTTVSRLSGFVRAALLSYALGATVHADIFNLANSLPNMLYILLAGGVFNAVLVPQLVRAMRSDPDRGEAYTSRVITVAGLFLFAVTVLLVVAAPLLVDLVAHSYQGDQRASAIAFTRYCLPQVFGYGMFVLVGQILNARGSFGPMMWAPIANNIISVVVIGAYLAAYGTASGAELRAGYGSGEELLLGLGSTLGILVQLVVLVPALRRAGYHYRPRFDLRGSGLGHTLRLGAWTVLFVIVNQVAYVVVQRLATAGGALTVYSNSFLFVMVPHSIITVSLATAMLPGLSAHAAAVDHPAVARSLGATLRSALTVVVPFAALLPLVAADLARLLLAHGAAAGSTDRYAPTLSLFGLGICLFTVHYLVLRGFYALELNRTVFFVQCAVAGTNIVTALVLVGFTSSEDTAPALVLAYAASYAVGSVISYAVLRRRLGGLDTTRLVSFGARLLLATAVATGVTFVLARALGGLSVGAGSGVGPAVLLGRLAAVAAVDVLVFVVLARLLRIRELDAIVALVGRRRRAEIPAATRH